MRTYVAERPVNSASISPNRPHASLGLNSSYFILNFWLGCLLFICPMLVFFKLSRTLAFMSVFDSGLTHLVTKLRFSSDHYNFSMEFGFVDVVGFGLLIRMLRETDTNCEDFCCYFIFMVTVICHLDYFRLHLSYF